MFTVSFLTERSHLGSASFATVCGLKVHCSSENAKHCLDLLSLLECSTNFIQTCNYPFPYLSEAKRIGIKLEVNLFCVNQKSQ